MRLCSEVIVFIAQRIERDGFDEDEVEAVADYVDEVVSAMQNSGMKNKKEIVDFLREYARDIESKPGY